MRDDIVIRPIPTQVQAKRISRTGKSNRVQDTEEETTVCRWKREETTNMPGRGEVQK